MAKPLLPDVWMQIQDGALGILPPPTEGVHAKIGVSSAGPVNQIVSVTSLDQVRDTFGTGPLAEALAVALALSGGPVYAIRAQASQAGTVEAVAASRVGGSDGTLNVSGSPNDRYEVIVEITRSGSVAGGNAAFKYPLDGGDTWSAEKALVGTYALEDTGLTLAFADGVANPTFEAGDRFSFETTAPAMALTDLNAAIDALLADPREWGWLHVVGAATPAVAAGVAARMAEAEAAYRFAFAVLEARDFASNEDEDAWMGALLSEWQNFADPRVAAVAGHAEITSPLTGRVHRRSLAWHYCARLAKIPIHEDPARVASGPVPGIVSLYHDEFVKPGLDPAGFTTFRTIIGRSGFYVTNGRMKAPEGSDYDLVQNRRVMDRACKVARNAALRFLNDSVRVNDVGNIDERDAKAIEGYVKGLLEADLVAPGHVSAVDVSLKRDSNVLSTRSTTLTVRVRPLGYLKWIEVDIGFTNPALQPA